MQGLLLGHAFRQGIHVHLGLYHSFIAGLPKINCKNQKEKTGKL
jgi:hypothetical protein